MVIDYGNTINWDAGNEFAEAMEAASCAQETADIAYDEAREAHKAAQDAAQDAACAQETADLAMERAGEALEKAENASVKIDGNDKVLSQEENGLMSTIRLAHDPATGVLTLSGKQGTVIDAVNLPLHEILTGAEMVTNPEGQPEGTYIALHLSTETGPQTLYIDATDLIDTYTPGNAGISVSGYTISLEVDGNSGLAVGADGLGFAPGNAPMTAAQSGKLAGIEAGAQVNTVNSVAGKTGDVTLDKSDVGLSSVDNTADADKPVSAAQATAIAQAVGGIVPTWDAITGKPAVYPPSAHEHSALVITSGLLPVERGGTGADTAAGALAALGGVDADYVNGLLSRDPRSVLIANDIPSFEDDAFRWVNTTDYYYTGVLTFKQSMRARVWCQGGGGGGAGGYANIFYAGSGGSAGELTMNEFYFTEGTPIPITFGFRGLGGTGTKMTSGSVAAHGTDGGTTSFGSHLSAYGGIHGSGISGVASFYLCGNDMNTNKTSSTRLSIRNVGGQAMLLRLGTDGYGEARSGAGANSYFGTGGVGIYTASGNSATTGSEGVGYGSGGAGGVCSGGQVAKGGGGRPGCILIERIL